MFSWQGLNFLTSPIGSPGRLHPETAQCLKIDVAKIFVTVDLTKDLPQKMNFNIQGEEVMVEYIYPWLPKKCSKCEKRGHSVKACSKEKEFQKENQEEMEEGEVREVREEKKDKEEIISRSLEDPEENTECEQVALVESSEKLKLKEGEDVSSKEEITQGTENVEKEKEWSDVSPGKSSRSSNSSQKELESIFTKSRFDVLTPKEGKEVTVYEKEEQEEDDQHDKLQDKEVIHRRVLPREFKINHRYLIAKA